ncbi:hypothetical protein GCM10009118_04830 [Wandonia haliotis]|uniref:Secretion system C-terminal sorting domain-containing protein n=2 Tax=Wandonia haliotis TaxID=574963 RepID=A0ABN1MM32_9FLAO
MILSLNSSYSQIIDPTWKNLVPNYSFEVVTEDYPNNPNGGVGPSGDPDYYCYDDGGYEWIGTYWQEVYEWTHPLRKSVFCGWSRPPVGTANVLRNGAVWSTHARSGINRGNGTNGEFLVVPLWHGGLETGKIYFIETFRRGNGTSNVYFSNGQTRQCGNNKDVESPSGGVLLKSFSANSGDNWTRTKHYYSSFFDLDWMTLGVNGDPGDGTGGGDWDDIRIYEVQPNGCRDNWYFDNTVFNYPTEFFQAGNNIYVGKGMDPEDGINHIAGEVRILNGSHAILQAGNQVILGDGFTMEPGGSRLLVENQPCSDGLCPNTISFTDQLICDQPGKLIGDSNVDYWGTSVSWSPADHLDDPTSANPYFTTPAGAGVVDYTVTVNYTCDTGFEYTQSFPVTVQYSNSSDLTASISVTNTDEGTEHFTADFSISEGVTEITINQLGMPFYSETFYRGVDFSGTTFHWEMPDGWLTGSCQDSYFSVEAVNGCSDASQTIQLPWEKDYQGIIEFEHQWDPEHAPNCCVINMYDGFCFYTEFADSYELAVFGPSGSISPIHTSSGAITSNTMCIWNGEGLDPYYYDNFAYPQSYSLTLYNVCGQELYKHGYVVVTTGTKSANGNQGLPSKGEKYEREIQELTSGNERLLLFPNPNKGSFQVQLPAFETPGTLQVRDFTGRIIYEEMPETTEVTCELNAAAGTYFLHWQNDNKNEVIRFVIE